MNLGSIAQYGIAGAALAVMAYIVAMMFRQFANNRTAEEFRELTKAIENNGQAVTRLCFLIEQQAVFMQRLMERLDALWERTITKG